MKQPEYIEGPEVLENFKRRMIAPFKVPKKAIGEGRKKGTHMCVKDIFARGGPPAARYNASITISAYFQT
jgi:hypothetical protein